MSPVTCYLSPVMMIFFKTCFIIKKKVLILENKKGQSGGASRWRVRYQRGLPCLVYYYMKHFVILNITWWMNCYDNFVINHKGYIFLIFLHSYWIYMTVKYVTMGDHLEELLEY